MYTNFFSLSELPFSIAPDPKYLFMSDRHREALTHLNYGLGCSGSGDASFGGSGGFVLLTGEVGTGKTTVSRCLMADLPDNTQLAFILNPTLSSQELLATICDQLKIRYRKTGATLKTLTDKIAEKLLKNHANDINTLLIIDEAQHLEPEVLEQLRLLTNLETNTKKLLQVILIGQPELQQLLKRRDLRQLAQRITARYHLLPLNKQELVLYIKHRLSVADCHRALFNPGALTAIHKLSQGIPRLINLICHSALMEAYNSNNAVVNKAIIYKAASHALGDDFDQTHWWQYKSSQIALAASAFILVLLAGFWLGQEKQAHAIPLQVESNQQQDLVPVVKLDKRNNDNPIETVVPEENASQHVTPQPEMTVEQKVISAEPAKTKPLISQAAKPNIVTRDTTKQDTVQQNTVKQQAKPSAKPKENKKYQVAAVDGVSDDLLARFQAAVDDTNYSATNQAKTEWIPTVDSDVISLTSMPVWVQEGVPNLHFEQHIYASDGQGWVNINGRDRYEGDKVADGLILDKILPQHVILTYRGETFSLPALTNW